MISRSIRNLHCIGSVIDPHMNFSGSVDFTYGSTVIIPINIARAATGIIELTINGSTYQQTISNGSVTFSIPNLSVNKYPITASYAGDKRYSESTIRSEVNVLKASTITKLTTNKHSYAPDEFPVLVTVKVTDSNNVGISGESVAIYIDGQKYTYTLNSNGIVNASFSSDKISTGAHVITAVYNNSNYSESSDSTTIEVNKGTASYLNLSSSSNNLHNGDNLVISCEIPSNSGVGMDTITINLCDKATDDVVRSNTISIPSNSNGQFTTTFTNLSAGEYVVRGEYSGSQFYRSCSETSSINITVTPNS